MATLRTVDTRREEISAALLNRQAHFDNAVRSVVEKTVNDVRTRGDVALLESARQFDSPNLGSIVTSRAEIEAARVSEPILLAIRTARTRIEAFHQAQFEALVEGWDREISGHRWSKVDAIEAQIGQRLLPVLSAGVYVPGGRAAYPSSVLMNAIPALVAGVQEIVVTTPARSDGTLDPAVLVALRELGISRVFKIGGAAAIASMAFGTASVPRVEKIVGPGNAYVNEAKRQVWGSVGLDGYAGPSEVCVLVDDSANPAWAAADLLTQIEHAPDNAGFLISTCAKNLRAVLAEIDRQLEVAPRAEIIRSALTNHSLAILAQSLDEACQIVNRIAPEHLTLAIDDPEAALAHIRNAGCVLLGEWTPESAGDYCIGPSHTLPTAGAARFGSPVNVMDFLKFQSVSKLNRNSLAALAPTIETFGKAEGFPAHANGAAIRFK